MFSFQAKVNFCLYAKMFFFRIFKLMKLITELSTTKNVLVVYDTKINFFPHSLYLIFSLKVL